VFGALLDCLTLRRSIARAIESATEQLASLTHCRILLNASCFSSRSVIFCRGAIQVLNPLHFLIREGGKFILPSAFG
jgi:hypothetical protein